MKSIRLIECMSTWQGEGPDTGRYMVLCRFKKCQLNCSFCDTMVLMKNAVEGEYTFDSIQSKINSVNGGLLITGGEPTLYLDETASLLTELEYSVANVETNGHKLKELILQTPKHLNVKFIYSPKISLNDDEVKSFINNEKIYFKFVIDKYDGAGPTITTRSLNKLQIMGFDMSHVYLMPKGINYGELKQNSKTVCDLAEYYNCNISTRMHLIYNFY